MTVSEGMASAHIGESCPGAKSCICTIFTPQFQLATADKEYRRVWACADEHVIQGNTKARERCGSGGVETGYPMQCKAATICDSLFRRSFPRTDSCNVVPLHMRHMHEAAQAGIPHTSPLTGVRACADKEIRQYNSPYKVHTRDVW